MMSDQELQIPRGWFRRISLREIMAAVVFIVGLYGWFQRVQFDSERLAERVAALEKRLEKQEEVNGEIYMRRDVLSERLDSIERRLSVIETNVRKIAQ
jgi:hypothetical protein